jgi:hypothetical protein
MGMMTELKAKKICRKHRYTRLDKVRKKFENIRLTDKKIYGSVFPGG